MTVQRKTEFHVRLRQIDLELCDGETSYKYGCPNCGQAGSFGITKRRGLLLYYCHRSACDCSGAFGASTHGPAAPNKLPFNPRLFTDPTLPVDEAGLARILDRYGIRGDTVNSLGWRTNDYGTRLVMPVLSPLMGVRGYIAKSLDRYVQPKSLPYREVDGVFIGWYKGQSEENEDYCVIVEDCISAAKAAQCGHNSVALLGTNLNPEAVKEIFEHVSLGILCLDRDATKKAFDYRTRYSLQGNFLVVPLSKDIKDMSEQELKEWNGNIQTALHSQASRPLANRL
jgi:hypothetical protein